ncbi:hypothetical protein QR685DRAFT_605433 [Neurospora intermedia]|uniref:C2H2-type domain-containing protein n=1 Tax=Neurospora intermedia TaxID=5142 RepID=A0ABR3DIV1_NEUIN
MATPSNQVSSVLSVYSTSRKFVCALWRATLATTTVAKALMGLLLENSLSTKTDFKSSSVTCPLCQTDETADLKTRSKTGHTGEAVWPETVWIWLNGPIETFHTEQLMTRRSQITTVCFVSILVVALWPLEIFISFIWSKVTHATNNQGTKGQPTTRPAEEPGQKQNGVFVCPYCLEDAGVKRTFTSGHDQSDLRATTAHTAPGTRQLHNHHEQPAIPPTPQRSVNPINDFDLSKCTITIDSFATNFAMGFSSTDYWPKILALLRAVPMQTPLWRMNKSLGMSRWASKSTTTTSSITPRPPTTRFIMPLLDLNLWVSQHQEDISAYFRCPTCNIHFNSIGQWIDHTRREHSDVAVTVAEERSKQTSTDYGEIGSSDDPSDDNSPFYYLPGACNHCIPLAQWKKSLVWFHLELRPQRQQQQGQRR